MADTFTDPSTTSSGFSPAPLNLSASVPVAPAVSSALSTLASPSDKLTPAQIADFQKQLSSLKEKALGLKATLDKQNQGGEISSKNAIAAAQNQPQPAAAAASSDNSQYYPPDTSDQGKSVIDGLVTQIQGELQAIQTSQSDAETLTQQFQDLMSQKDSAGMSLTDYQNTIAGLQAAEIGQPVQVASEIAGKGFATQSQIDALSNARNRILDTQIEKYSSLLNIRESYVNSMLKYSSADRTFAAQQADKLISLQGTLARLQQSADQANFNDFIKSQTLTDRIQNTAREEIATAYSVGGTPTQEQWAAAGYSGSPTSPKLYSAPFQDSNGDLIQVNQNNGTVRVLYKNQPTPGEWATAFRQEINNAYAGKYGKDGARETVIQSLEAQFPNMDKSLVENQVYSTLPDNWEKGMNSIKKLTAATIPADETQSIISDIQNRYSLSQIIDNYPDVSSDYLKSLYNEQFAAPGSYSASTTPGG